MARDVESLVLQMSADLRRFDKSMSAMRATADKRLNEVEKRAIKADRTLSRTMGNAGRNMVGALKNSLTGLAPVLAGAFSTAAVLKYADAYTALQNRLKAAGLEGYALRQVEDSLYESANRNGVAVAATAELYQRAALARNNLGASEEQLLALVSGTSAALRLQGTSATEASGALLQLGQILGGEKVQAQEYNSLIDQLPVLLQAAADGSDRFGGQISTLTTQVKAGKVTTQEFFAALLKGLGDVEARAASATPTVGAAFQTLNNQIGRYVGETDKGLSATQRMAQGIIALSENLDTIIPIVGVLISLIGGRYVLALAASATGAAVATASSVRYQLALAGLAARQAGVTTKTVLATGATASFNAMLLANPIGAAIVATAALSAGLMYLAHRSDDARIAKEELDRVVTAAEKVTGEYSAALAVAATKTGEERVEALKLADAIRATSQARIADIRLTAQQRVADQTAARKAAEEARARVANQPNRPGGNGPDPTRTNNTLALLAAERRLTQAGAAANDAFDAVKAAEDALATAEAPAARPAAAAATVTGGTGGGGAGGPSAEDLAAARRMLDLQAEIALLRAQDRAAEADARQDAVDVLTLTKQYEDAGFANARAKAQAQVGALASAREQARQAEEAARQTEGEARALDMMRGFALEMLGVQEQIALTDRDALAVRREILAIRQAERRAALEAAAADAGATDAERAAAKAALNSLPKLEGGENRQLAGSSQGARQAQDIVANLNPYENAVQQAADAYAEIDRMRTEDGLSEADAARAKAQIDADLRQKRLAGVQGMLGLIETLQGSSNKKLAALGKAAAIAQASIDGYLAIQKAWASAPFPFNVPAVAVTTAAVAANVASIAGMADGGLVGGSGGPRQDNQLTWLSTGEFVNTAASVRKNRPYLEAANNGADLGRLIPGLEGGGMVGRVNAATANVGALGSRPSNINMAVSVDLKGARGDREIEAVVMRAVDAGSEAAYQRAMKDAPGAVRLKERYRLGARR
tara:strand:- start:8795 stop:11794 length:3000 start_codon:yes stop_codon:yes gene_type:complete